MPSPDLMDGLHKVATETPERARLVNGILLGALGALGAAFVSVVAWGANRIYGNLLQATATLKDEVAQLRKEAAADREKTQGIERDLMLLRERAVVRNDCHAAHEAVLGKLEEIRTELATAQQASAAQVFERVNRHIEDHARGAL